MSFEQFWVILVKHWRLIMISFLVVGLGAYIGSKLMTPIYQSSALVQVAIRSSTNQADYNSLLASDQLVQTEASLAISDPVLRQVVSHYHGMTVAQLAGEATSTAKLNTQLFEIDVADPSPTRAAALANDIAATLIGQQQQAIQQNNQQAQQQIQNNIDATGKQIDATTKNIAALQAKGGNQGQVAVLQAQLNGYQQHYTQLQTALAELELAQAESGNPLQIAQSANPATSPVRPNKLLNTGGGLLVGLLLGIVLAILYERFDTRVRTPEVLTQLLGWSVLAAILRANSSKREDVINPAGQNANVEPYRILRTSIGFSALDKPLHSILVTSAIPRDGKSVIAANLAIFMAKAGKNTLLIDADLRRPTQHVLFELPAGSLGLSNAVLAFGMQTGTDFTANNQSASASLTPFVHAVGIANLWVMPSGPLPPNPSEMLNSKAMQRFLTIIKDCGVEIVIFDSPPLLGLSDTSILASKADGVLVVVDITRANKGKLMRMKATLAQTGANVLGCVVNKQRKSRSDTDYTYSYYFDEQPDEERQSAKNGHVPTVPLPPASSWSQTHLDRSN